MTSTIAAPRRGDGLLDTNEIRVEGRDKVSGKTKYTADVHLPNMLRAAFTTSPLAHAKILSIDTSAAKRVPGVHAVLTSADIGPGRRSGRMLYDMPVLAYDRVLYIGDRVAAVAAETREAAEEAARLVNKPVILVVMGVSSSGKTTVAKFLADALGCPFREGDDLHPQANVDKMRRGLPLTDADRAPWLDRIASELDHWRAHGLSGVLTCSALKRAYRAKIIGDRRDVTLVYLSGSYERVKRRMAARRNHFMPVALLDSQFAALEPPGADEHPITVAVEGSGVAIAGEVARELVERQRRKPDSAS